MRTLALAVASLLATLVVACGDDDGTAQEGDGAPAKVVVGVIPIADVAPAWLGAEKGFFREEDIDISFRPIAGGAEVIPQVLRGDVQFAFGNPVSLAFAQQRGLEPRYVTEGVQGGSSEKDATNGLVVHKDSDIRRVEDLAGRTFAVNILNSLGEVTISTALEKEGVDTSDLEFVEVPFPDMLPALERRQFDVAWLPEPFVSQAVGRRPPQPPRPDGRDLSATHAVGLLRLDRIHRGEPGAGREVQARDEPLARLRGRA